MKLILHSVLLSLLYIGAVQPLDDLNLCEELAFAVHDKVLFDCSEEIVDEDDDKEQAVKDKCAPLLKEVSDDVEEAKKLDKDVDFYVKLEAKAAAKKEELKLERMEYIEMMQEATKVLETLAKDIDKVEDNLKKATSDLDASKKEIETTQKEIAKTFDAQEKLQDKIDDIKDECNKIE